jgi:hypothetical protein
MIVQKVSKFLMKTISINEGLLNCIKSHVKSGNNLTFLPQLSGMDFSVYFDKPIEDKLMNQSLYNWIMDEVFNVSEIVDHGKFDGQFYFEIDSTTNNLYLIADLSWFDMDSYDPYHSEKLKYSVEYE